MEWTQWLNQLWGHLQRCGLKLQYEAAYDDVELRPRLANLSLPLDRITPCHLLPLVDLEKYKPSSRVRFPKTAALRYVGAQARRLHSASLFLRGIRNTDKMDETLLYFEYENYASDEVYDKTVKSHITKISRLFKDQAPAIVAKAPQLLEVRWRFPHCWVFDVANNEPTDRPPHQPLDLTPSDSKHPQAHRRGFPSHITRLFPRVCSSVLAVFRRTTDTLRW